MKWLITNRHSQLNIQYKRSMILNNKPFIQNKLQCPKCKEKDSLIRVKRHFFDRVISFFTPVRRYNCFYCSWEGLLRARPSSPKKA